jgi:hypothetical protein
MFTANYIHAPCQQDLTRTKLKMGNGASNSRFDATMSVYLLLERDRKAETNPLGSADF